MRIDLQCPVEVWRCILPDEPKEPCELILFNLDEKVIVSVEVTMILVDEHGSEISRVVERAHDMEGRPGENFSMLMELPENMVKAGVSRLEITVEKAWFEDGIVWRKARGNLIEYTTNAMPRGRSLSKLRYVAGPDAIGYPQRQGALWLCVCGRPNHESQAKCVRCGRSQDEVFRTCSREAVEAAMTGQETRLTETTHSATRLGSGDTRDFIARKKRRGGRRAAVILLLLLLAAGAAFGYVRVLKPYLDYRHAVRLMETGSYGEAMEAFAGMSGYRDSDALLTETRYLDAVRMKERGEFVDAAAAFAGLGNYKDSAEQIPACEYLRADTLLKDGQIAEARGLFVELGDYQDSPDRVKECDYEKAEELYRAGSRWLEAAEAYEAMGDYRSSTAKARYCRYMLAGQLLSAGRWEEAYAAYDALGTYEDSRNRKLEALYQPGVLALAAVPADYETALTWLTREELNGYKDTADCRDQAWYLKGQALLQAGRVDDAGSAFRMAGSYQDAEQLVVECLYRPAEEAMEAGDWLVAAERFERLQGYKDADSNWKECYYQAAMAKMEQAGERMAESAWTEAKTAWEEAAAYFGKVAGYADADQQVPACVFGTARACAESGDHARALQLIAELPEDYEGADALRKECLYRTALAAHQRGEYGAAADIFESLTDYRDSAAQAKKARYAQAEACGDDGDYETAWKIYTALGDYEDSASRADDARFAQASALETAGSYADAAAIYRELGEYRGSDLRYEIVMMARGDELLAEGLYTAAREAFAALEDNVQAKARIKACDYAKAEAMAAEGNKEAAAELFASLADYGDAADRANRLWYELAGEAQAAGNLTGAEALYGRIPGYLDSDAKLAEIRDEVYENEVYSVPAKQAREAMDAGDPAAAVAILDSLNLSALPERFAYIRDLYVRACYTEGKRLYDEGDKQAAYPYLQRCAGYEDTDALMAAETAWRILGTWRDETRILVLRRDGSFSMANEEGTYRLVDDSIVIKGEAWFTVLELAGDTLTLLDHRGGTDSTLVLTRTAPDTLAALARPASVTETEPTGNADTGSTEAAGAEPETAESGEVEAEAARTAEAEDGPASAEAEPEDVKPVESLPEGATDRADSVEAESGEAADGAGSAEAEPETPASDKTGPEYNDPGKLVYQAAVAAMDAGNWAEAAGLFRLIPGCADADSLLLQCVFRRAGECVEIGDYATALLLMAELPEDYRGLAELRLTCGYGQAEEAYANGEYARAAEAFEALGDYGDSAAQASKARYAQAGALEAEGRYAEAADVYLALGNYGDSAARARAARLAQASKLLENGAYAEARVLYASFPDSAEAAEGVLACDYARAEALADEGEAEAAAELFASLADYADARARAHQLRYGLAEAAWQAGDAERAAALCAKLSGDDDSDGKVAALLGEIRGAALREAQAELDAGRAGRAAALLDGIVRSGAVPEEDADRLRDLYLRACYAEGKRLCEAGDREAAYPYLQRCAGYEDTDDVLYGDTAWRIRGTWQDGEHVLSFRWDGIMTVDGEEHPYLLSGYAIQEGETGENWFKLVNAPKRDSMYLRDVRNGSSKVLQLTRTAPDEPAPLPAEAEIAGEGPEAVPGD